MHITTKLRRGEGPFWGRCKPLARQVLRFHLPVWSVTRPLFTLLYGLHVLLRGGTRWILRFWWYEPLFRSQCAAVGEGFQLTHLPFITGEGRILIGDQVRFWGKPSFAFSNRFRAVPELSIGDDTHLGHDCSFAVADSVRIGKHCLIASRASVRDFDGHPVDAARRRAKEPTPPEAVKPTVIGDDVWIGTGAIILKGVTIGDRSIVAAGAVVSKDVPPDVIVGGNPARVVKKLARP